VFAAHGRAQVERPEAQRSAIPAVSNNDLATASVPGSISPLQARACALMRGYLRHTLNAQLSFGFKEMHG
jgi:hypothetical protein